MAGTVCFTSFTFGYLSRARVLAQTLRAAHPDWTLWALVVDEPPPDLDLHAALAPFDAVMRADALDIPRFRAWMFKHDLVEACTAVKGAMLEMLLRRGADKVVYLDPDIAVFHPLSGIERRLDDASIVLTPHQLAANDGLPAMADNELTSLKYGTYNLGFVAVRNDDNGRAFAAWWSAVTRQACYDDVEAGLFTDQKYCDLVPGLFDGVHVERDPGCNVASWNLSRRSLAFGADGALLVNGAALKFYHFTKIGGVGDTMTERYGRDNVEVYEVVNWYKRAVAANGFIAAAEWPWRYGRFASGAPVPRPVRLLWRARPDLQAAFDDPFAVTGDCLHAWLQREMPALLAG
ncbi:hypothetical protein [Limobrevibacterium gyesilva]|uniref:Glycosyl transferase n=1 Tax=Limobrevibacterium gyesilva TaxID=2991712 RepID=A0AA41YP13_9PROT|nr:hypothetical protein [Limobrevibacterium gyesilva]MCW3473875.1 hypothetical protein [Limobrevibacterium gyesilva]